MDIFGKNRALEKGQIVNLASVLVPTIAGLKSSNRVISATQALDCLKDVVLLVLVSDVANHKILKLVLKGFKRAMVTVAQSGMPLTKKFLKDLKIWLRNFVCLADLDGQLKHLWFFNSMLLVSVGSLCKMTSSSFVLDFVNDACLPLLAKHYGPEKRGAFAIYKRIYEEAGMDLTRDQLCQLQRTFQANGSSVEIKTKSYQTRGNLLYYEGRFSKAIDAWKQAALKLMDRGDKKRQIDDLFLSCVFCLLKRRKLDQVFSFIEWVHLKSDPSGSLIRTVKDVLIKLISSPTPQVEFQAPFGKVDIKACEASNRDQMFELVLKMEMKLEDDAVEISKFFRKFGFYKWSLLFASVAGHQEMAVDLLPSLLDEPVSFAFVSRQFPAECRRACVKQLRESMGSLLEHVLKLELEGDACLPLDSSPVVGLLDYLKNVSLDDRESALVSDAATVWKIVSSLIPLRQEFNRAMNEYRMNSWNVDQVTQKLTKVVSVLDSIHQLDPKIWAEERCRLLLTIIENFLPETRSTAQFLIHHCQAISEFPKLEFRKKALLKRWEKRVIGKTTLGGCVRQNEATHGEPITSLDQFSEKYPPMTNKDELLPLADDEEASQRSYDLKGFFRNLKHRKKTHAVVHLTSLKSNFWRGYLASDTDIEESPKTFKKTYDWCQKFEPLDVSFNEITRRLYNQVNESPIYAEISPCRQTESNLSAPDDDLPSLPIDDVLPRLPKKKPVDLTTN